MTRYTPSTIADDLSKALWDLARPVRTEQDTQSLFGTITATDGSTWLVVQDDYSINVHPDASLGRVGEILQPWVVAGHLPPDTLEQLGGLVAQLRGNPLVVWDSFPQLFKDMSKTHEEMLDAGLLEEPKMP